MGNALILLHEADLAKVESIFKKNDSNPGSDGHETLMNAKNEVLAFLRKKMVPPSSSLSSKRTRWS